MLPELTCEFTLVHYEHILRRVKAAGYRTVRFSDLKRNTPENPVCIIRHDVDLDPAAAIAMAEVERRQDIRSSFYFLIGSPLYNLFSPAVIEVVQELARMGHEIGLHYDGAALSLCNSDQTAVIAEIERHCHLMEVFFQRPIESVSFHRPTKELLQANPDLGTRINTYAPTYFNDYLYVSDSSRRWRRGCACCSVPEQPERSVQLLTHPEWWLDCDVPKQQRLWQLLSKRFSELDAAIGDNITGYERFLPPESNPAGRR